MECQGGRIPHWLYAHLDPVLYTGSDSLPSGQRSVFQYFASYGQLLGCHYRPAGVWPYRSLDVPDCFYAHYDWTLCLLPWKRRAGRGKESLARRVAREGSQRYWHGEKEDPAW